MHLWWRTPWSPIFYPNAPTASLPLSFWRPSAVGERIRRQTTQSEASTVPPDAFLLAFSQLSVSQCRVSLKVKLYFHGENPLISWADGTSWSIFQFIWFWQLALYCGGRFRSISQGNPSRTADKGPLCPDNNFCLVFCWDRFAFHLVTSSTASSWSWARPPPSRYTPRYPLPFLNGTSRFAISAFWSFSAERLSSPSGA